MTCSASAAARKLNISKDTLRYYEKEGLLPPIKEINQGIVLILIQMLNGFI